MNFMGLMLAEAATSTGSTSTTSSFSSWTTLIMLAIVVVVFYFFLYRPQKKQEKQTSSMRSGLAVGDEITTIGGIIGKIISIKDETVLLETSADKTKIRILRDSVKSVDVKADEAKP